ncbi:MAG: M20/M25/M40 family metallo-hydrolase [Alphaproteobacteria bacterium]|nr:M20/M25/M40 family metallo-hydrolase [Alphaproteobacteria bacterium]
MKILSLAILWSATTMAADLRPDQLAFRDLYKELVETNTTLSVGSCTDAAAKMAARLRAAGYPDKDLHAFGVADKPKEGGLVAWLPGFDPREKAILLLAHIDVVEADGKDWRHDPFKLTEDGDYYYGRGTTDDKAMAAIFTDSRIRYRRDGFRPKRTLKLALTCGEETSIAFNGVQYLIDSRRDLIDAGFAINEGGVGMLDANGKRVALEVQMGEKVYQDFEFTVSNPGGHSSQPVKENAIYRLAAALSRLDAHEFPVALTDTTRAYFRRMSAITGGETGRAMRALAETSSDAKAVAEVAKNKTWNAMMRTTCVATMVDAGHAVNALPQRATANVNCRLLPGVSVDSVHKTLIDIAGDPAVTVTIVESQSVTFEPPPLTPEIMKPLEAVAGEIYPGVPVVPTMITGATDGSRLNAAGIPTYGIEGVFVDPDLGNIHGINERIRVRSLMDGRDFLHKLVQRYAMQ